MIQVMDAIVLKDRSGNLKIMEMQKDYKILLNCPAALSGISTVSGKFIDKTGENLTIDTSKLYRSSVAMVDIDRICSFEEISEEA